MEAYMSLAVNDVVTVQVEQLSGGTISEWSLNGTWSAQYVGP